MRTRLLIPILIVRILLPASSGARQTATTAPTAQRDSQAVLLLQRSLAALTGTTTVSDVTMTGTANWIAGSDDETGTATLKATAIGQGRIDLSLSNGPRSEVRDFSVTPSTGSWSGSDSTWHPIANHNLWTDPTWFYPGFLIGRVLSDAGYQVSPADAETLDGVVVQHITVSQQYAGSQQLPSLLQKLSQVDIYLSSSNLLPVAIAFNVHADNDALTNLPVRIEFANYQALQTAQVPYHIQRFINSGLALDVIVTSIQFNTGLTSSNFTTQ